ncbi:MAG: hypothetical protein ABFD49_07150 [Armatimonadota bacterium]|nr:hypothetical protein [bacterium]
MNEPTHDDLNEMHDDVPICPDRLNLHQLASAIDRDCFEAVIQGLNKCIDLGPMKEPLDGLHKECASLIAELQRDFDDLKSLVHMDDIFNEHQVIPGPKELAMLMPKVYVMSEQFQTLEDDAKAEILIIRTIWVFNTLLQAIGRFTHMLSQLRNNPRSLHLQSLNNAKITYEVVPPSAFAEVCQHWNGISHLIVEYITCKAELLAQAGLPTALVRFDKDEPAEEFVAAELAVMKADLSAPGEISRAFRMFLLRKLQLIGSMPSVILANNPTHALVNVAAKCGVDFGVDPILLSALIAQMEMADRGGANVRVSDTYPIFRVVRYAAEMIEKQIVTSAIPKKVSDCLRSLHDMAK